MAHLWLEEQPGDWVIIPLNSVRVDLRNLSDHSGAARPRRRARSGGTWLVRTTVRERNVWHLITSPETAVSVNGLPVLGGLRVLENGDEIRVPGDKALFYSTEELARVVAMPVTEQPMMCPRCRQRVEPESPAVCCPACDIWHHQSEALPCWTYAPTCALCPQPTPFDTGFRWTPQEL